MLIKDAMGEYLTKVKIEEARKERARLEDESAAELKRQEFICALRKRIETQYDLELTADDVAAWDVVQTHVDRYRMRWHLRNSAQGHDDEPGCVIELESRCGVADVEPGQQSVKLVWCAWSQDNGYGNAKFDHPVAALVYAKTGKSL